MVWVVEVVPAKIFGPSLDVGMSQRGGMPIRLIKEVILGFFSRRDGVLLDA
jgi:hypothetical protein